MESFFYKSGKFETIKKWQRPNLRSILSFFNQVLIQTDILNKYDLIIYGGVLYKNLDNTWDLDINLSSSNIPNHVDIENDFLILNKIGEDNNLLIDVHWSSVPVSKIIDMDINMDNYLELDLDFDYIKVGFLQKIVNGEVTIFRNLITPENSFGEYLIKYKLKDSIKEMMLSPKWSKRQYQNRAKVKYLTSDQIMAGDYYALIEESNKII